MMLGVSGRKRRGRSLIYRRVRLERFLRTQFREVFVMTRVGNTVAIFCLCGALLAGCGAKDPAPKGAKSDVTQADSARGSQTAAPKTAPNSSAAVPATIDLATLLAEVPTSIVPGRDVGNDRLLRWLNERTNGRRIQEQWVVRFVGQERKPDEVHYARRVVTEPLEFIVNDANVKIWAGNTIESSPWPLGVYYPSLSGEQAVLLDSWEGREITVNGVVVQVVVYPLFEDDDLNLIFILKDTDAHL